jgi:hypothetical protein
MESRKRGQLLALAVIVLLGGCAARSRYMQPVPATAVLQPPPGQALVVFVRPSSFARSMRFTVLTSRGQFLGDSLPSSHFAVALPPGQHVFLVWAENTGALRAELAPGRIYYVEVSAKMGFGSARAHLLAITPRHARWARLPEWLRDTRRLQPNMATGQAYLNSRSADTAERIRRAMEHLTKYTPAELAERTIVAADGAVAPGNAVAPPPPPPAQGHPTAYPRAPAPPPPPPAQGYTPAPAPPPPPPAQGYTPAPAPPPPPAPGNCTKDVDCPGDQICQNRQCVAPASP